MKPYEAREIAAQAWCDNSTSHLDMIPELAEAFAKILVEEVGKASPASVPEGTNMDKQYLQTEFDTFFEFDSDDRSFVTSTSAKMFAEHMALPIEAQVEQLRAELSALREAVQPFVRLMKSTSGRIPTERLSFADWHALAKVSAGDTATTERPNA